MSLTASRFLEISPMEQAWYKHGKDREMHSSAKAWKELYRGSCLERYLSIQSIENDEKIISLCCIEQTLGICLNLDGGQVSPGLCKANEAEDVCKYILFTREEDVSWGNE